MGSERDFGLFLSSSSRLADTIRVAKRDFLLVSYTACTVSEIIATEVQNSTFSVPHFASSVEFWNLIPVGFGTQVAKTHPVILYVARCDYDNPLPNITDRRTSCS